MKLKLDEIQAKSMPLTMHGQPVQQPVLKIVAGDFEATTSRYNPYDLYVILLIILFIQ